MKLMHTELGLIDAYDTAVPSSTKKTEKSR